MNISTAISAPSTHPARTTADVVVVGAGPYGLSVAAHLRSSGLHTAIFGKPLALWQDQMPAGMLLRSYWWASSLSDPFACYSISRYFAEQRRSPAYPLPREDFLAYGAWFQHYAAPEVDETYVSTIERQESTFLVTLTDGRVVQTPRVIMAPGLAYYVYRPPEYTHLPAELVSHTSEHASFDRFAGKRVAILGAGQSALESAALLHECGAEVTVVARHPIRWLVEELPEQRSLWQALRHPQAGIAPGWFNWGLERLPYGFQLLPRTTKDQLLRGRGSYGPAASGWLKPRILTKVALLEGFTLQQVAETDRGLSLTLSNGTHLYADHLLLATGYRVNLWNLPMLPPALLAQIRLYHNAPVLNNHFESSVRGLYFVGISSLASCGPLYRFVIGTDATARRVSQAILQSLPTNERIRLLS